MSEPNILVINLGATSSKFAYFKGIQSVHESSIPLDDALVKVPLAEQRPERLNHLKKFLEDKAITPDMIDAVAARGGLTKPLSSRGVYRVDEQMYDDLSNDRYGSHPSNLSSVIAQDWVKEYNGGTPVYIVDPVNTDTIWDEARVSGIPEVERLGRHHTLNVHRAAREAAKQLGKFPFQVKLVVGHFGSGTSIASVVGGRTVDVNDAQLGEGPFSVSRTGTLPVRGVLDLAYAEPDRKKLEQRLARAGGIAAYTGTADFMEIEKRLSQGDPAACKAYEALVFQSVKYCAAAAGALGEKPDAIVLTGGLIKSKRFENDLRQRLKWITEIISIPGEDEMAALAEGIYGALKGDEPVLPYNEIATATDAPPRTMKEVLARAAGLGGVEFVVAGGHHPEIAETVRMCADRGISGFTLVGPGGAIKEQLEAEGVDPASVTIKDSDNIEADSIALVQANPNAALVKGACNTAALLKSVLACLPKDAKPFLSHVAVIENHVTGNLLGITDGGLNIELDINKKIGIMENAIRMFQSLGITKPHVLMSAGMEDKGQDIPAIVDAREIVTRHKAGEWADAVIDGPFGIDVGLASEAAAVKGIKTPLAGHTDIVVTPNLESCNFAIKLAIYFSRDAWGGLVVGGPFPVVMGSRSDDALSRVCSIALAQLVVAGMRNG